ncbi:hypothetical protein VTN00DRAFT_290 [Thermoascus crustaceus]|uniref:uncharacterized protein n=1 Tax=Thermoascus crustaceus TaxID=5088 RepID=UPI003744AC8B
MSDTSTYHPSLDDPNVFVLYRYHPTRAGAIIFIVAFFLTTALHGYQIVSHRTWYFLPLLVGGIFEIIGYVGRVLSSYDQWALGPYIMQSLLLLVAPALFAASVYMILGRIILLVGGEELALVPRRWLTKVFVMGDVLSFCLQGAGGGIQAIGTLSSLNTGEKIIIVGLFVQIVFFGFFIVVAGSFHLRFTRHNQRKQIMTPTFTATTTTMTTIPWKKHLYALYIASALVMIRSIFRVVEYLMGNNGYLLRHEHFLYVFDATLMFGVMVLFNVVHPSEVTTVYKDNNRYSVPLEAREMMVSTMTRRDSGCSGRSCRSLV